MPINRAAFRAWWDKFDADDAFSFTTPRFVRIQDRRLGIPYLVFLAAIVAYIIGVVIVKNGGYLSKTDVEGVTRLQLLRPTPQARVAFENLPYCNQTNDLPTYQTPFMTTPYYELTCVQEDEVTLVFPPDELNAMFVTTRATISNQFYPPNCAPQLNVSCDFVSPFNFSIYPANVELFTLKLDHSLDITVFNLFKTASSMTSRGLQDIDGNVIHPCDAYTRAGVPCPSLQGDIFPLGSLLEAADVPGATLDSTLNLSSPTSGGLAPTRRYSGMVLLLDIVYSGTIGITGSTDGIEYMFRPQFAEDQFYKIQQSVIPAPTPAPLNTTGDFAYQLVNRHGIRIVVRQTGQIGRFDFQALLLSLTSSLTLLAIAKTVVELLAFYVLPLKFIYRQYRTIDTIDFSDLTDADAAAFKKHDVINPHPRIGRGKVTALSPSVQTAWEVDVESGGGGASSAPVAATNPNTVPSSRASVGGGDDDSRPSAIVKNPLQTAGGKAAVQQRNHTQQGGFWGDLQHVYQSGWEGDDADAKDAAWH